jgi:hypothetical protein
VPEIDGPFCNGSNFNAWSQNTHIFTANNLCTYCNNASSTRACTRDDATNSCNANLPQKGLVYDMNDNYFPDSIGKSVNCAFA